MIEAEKASYPISWMCRLLKRAALEFLCLAPPGRERGGGPELASLVRAAFEADRGAHGCRRVTAALNGDGHRCSVGLAAGLMRELGLRACQPRPISARRYPARRR